ncbi:aminotransferase class I/II-fold pyridoxal phosphate-dependent enzyme [Corallococcus sp. ZKHCc1 1396]|uniref:Aminotransferase n=1 Tax=Corallococcus soli TaxID=2710757 RepID=A0ABR9PV77_9BACT|nr:histidinol-phosphate transaminase [Corallococcus soli]MBE4751749.1 aminotransferase class I/II-fold pyridoxal phosphate-dependent enzyme [Corallococcus soli]
MTVTYDPGVHIAGDGWLALHRNENLFAEPALLDDMARSALSKVTLSAYPHPTSLPLREKLAEVHGVDAANVFVGNGSDEVLSELLRLLRPSYDTLWMQDVGYVIHGVLADRLGYRPQTLPGSTFATGRVTAPDGPCLSVVDSPNAVTGHAVSGDDLAALAHTPGAFLVWDNAYGEISGDTLPREVRPNVVTVRSFSKFYALAGARVGYCIGDRALVARMLQRKDAFNVGAFSQAVALEALTRREHFLQLAGELRAARARLVTALEALGFEVRPPRGSFVFAKHATRDAAALHQGLEARRIAVRHFQKDGVRDYLRITVPPAAGMQRLLEALQALLSEASGNGS